MKVIIKNTLESIVNVLFDKHAVKNDFYYYKNGNRRIMKTTRGCELLVAIRDGTNINDEKKKLDKTWIPLKDIKQSHPVQVAEFAVARGIDKLPQFSWWVKHTLKKREMKEL